MPRSSIMRREYNDNTIRCQTGRAAEDRGTVNSGPEAADPRREVRRNAKAKSRGEEKKFPVVRTVLVVALLAAAGLLVFWRGLPGTASGGPIADAPAPEVVLKPLPEEVKPPEPDPRPPAVPTASTAPERQEAPAAKGPERPVSGGANAPAAARTPPQAAPAAQPSRPVQPQYRRARLFFASVDEEGRIAMKSVIRPVPIGDSPLLDTMNSLLAGPTPQEINLGLLSMIPTGSRLLSVTMRKDVAVLDFNESFRYNRLGVEGQVAQLRQVVFAATEFSNVKQVQILIAGKKLDFLGTEGIPIGKPLDRTSFGD
jgi:germination protein M